MRQHSNFEHFSADFKFVEYFHVPIVKFELEVYMISDLCLHQNRGRSIYHRNQINISTRHSIYRIVLISLPWYRNFRYFVAHSSESVISNKISCLSPVTIIWPTADLVVVLWITIADTAVHWGWMPLGPWGMEENVDGKYIRHWKWYGILDWCYIHGYPCV